MLLLLLLHLLLLRMWGVDLGAPCPAPGSLSAGRDAASGGPDAVLSGVLASRVSPPKVAAGSERQRSRAGSVSRAHRAQVWVILFCLLDRDANRKQACPRWDYCRHVQSRTNVCAHHELINV